MGQRVAERSRARSETIAPWAIAVAVAVLLVGGMIAFFTVEICDQNLLESGKTTRSCRHLTATDPPVIGAGLVMLAALGVFFEEVSGFGVSLKRRVMAAEDKAQEAHQTAVETKKTTEELKDSDADRAEGLKEVLGRTPTNASVEEITEDTGAVPATSPLVQLAREYNEVRWTMSSGSDRTAAMTSVVMRMMQASRELVDFDISAYLNSEDRGHRLAGFVHLYTNPNPRMAPDLIEALFKEDKPFGQYWAIRSLHEQVETAPGILDQNTLRQLRSLRDKLPGTDRAKELQKVLDKVGSPT